MRSVLLGAPDAGRETQPKKLIDKYSAEYYNKKEILKPVKGMDYTMITFSKNALF